MSCHFDLIFTLVITRYSHHICYLKEETEMHVLSIASMYLLLIAIMMWTQNSSAELPDPKDYTVIRGSLTQI